MPERTNRTATDTTLDAARLRQVDREPVDEKMRGRTQRRPSRRRGQRAAHRSRRAPRGDGDQDHGAKAVGHGSMGDKQQIEIGGGSERDTHQRQTLPARLSQDAVSGALRHVRSPGIRSAAQAAASPASAWPIGLAIVGAIMADSATFRPGRRKWSVL